MKARPLLRAWGPPAAWCLLIFVLSSLTLQGDADLPRGSDKAVHFAEFGILGFLAARAFGMTRPRAGFAAAALPGALLAAGWGALDEFHQLFVPGRSAEWADLGADAAGALAGAALLVLLARRTPGDASATSPGSS